MSEVNKEKPPEIPQREMSEAEAIQILKSVEIQLPLITITDIGKAIRCGIGAIEARQEVAREILGDGYAAVSAWVESEHSDEVYGKRYKQELKDAILCYLKSLKSRFIKEVKNGNR